MNIEQQAKAKLTAIRAHLAQINACDFHDSTSDEIEEEGLDMLTQLEEQLATVAVTLEIHS